MAKPANKVGLIIFRLPLVSAKKPHKCELIIMPEKPIALIMPRSWIVRFMSHCDTGKTKLIAKVSNKTLAKIRPEINMRMQLNLPKAKNKI